MVKTWYTPILLLILIQSIFLTPLFRGSFYQSHDGEVQVARFAAYFKAFSDHHIPPRWAGDLNYTYGSPVLNFYYPLPGYIAAALHNLHISFQDTFKILIALAFISAPLACYLWLKELVPKHIAFISSNLYGLAPYHFLNLYVRGDIAEMFALVFVPLVLWALTKNRIITGGILYGLLVLSHNGISLMFTPILLAYGLLFASTTRERIRHLSTFFIGLGISAFFWLPALLEMRYTLGDVFIGDMYKNHFPNFMQLVYSSWNFGPDVKNAIGLSPQIGPILMALSFIGILTIRKKQKNFRHSLFWFIVLSLGIFISLPVSSFIWRQLPLLKKFQFPWRFSALTTFAAASLTAFTLTYIRSRYFLVIITLLCILLSFPMMKVDTYINHEDEYYLSFPGTTYFHGETITKWSAGDASKYPKNQIEIIEGCATINNHKRNTIMQEFTVDAREPSKILINTFYYPGWRVYIDNQNTPIEFQDPNHRGLITFRLPPGTHHILVTFGETTLRAAANSISIVTIFGIVLSLIVKNKILSYKSKHEK